MSSALSISLIKVLEFATKRFECQGDVEIGHDTEIKPNVSLIGPCQVGSNCVISENYVSNHVQMGDFASMA